MRAFFYFEWHTFSSFFLLESIHQLFILCHDMRAIKFTVNHLRLFWLALLKTYLMSIVCEILYIYPLSLLDYLFDCYDLIIDFIVARILFL